MHRRLNRSGLWTRRASNIVIQFDVIDTHLNLPTYGLRRDAASHVNSYRSLINHIEVDAAEIVHQDQLSGYFSQIQAECVREGREVCMFQAAYALWKRIRFKDSTGLDKIQYARQSNITRVS